MSLRTTLLITFCITLCAVSVPSTAAAPRRGMAFVWKPLLSAPASLVQAYRSDKQVSDPPPTPKDVRGAHFIKVMEPGQSRPLFLVDPNQDDLTGSAGSPLLGYIPQGSSYREVLDVSGYWSSVADAPDVKAARREAARGSVVVLKQQSHGLPVLFFPASSRRIPIRPWRFNGKEYECGW